MNAPLNAPENATEYQAEIIAALAHLEFDSVSVMGMPARIILVGYEGCTIETRNTVATAVNNALIEANLPARLNPHWDAIIGTRGGRSRQSQKDVLFITIQA